MGNRAAPVDGQKLFSASELRCGEPLGTVPACAPLGMTATASSLEFLGQRFAGLFDQAASLYKSDQTFRDLCDVHAVCVRAVKRSEASGSSSLGTKYAAQQERLEAELLQRLQTSPAPSRGR